jgi:hypothetical protein
MTRFQMANGLLRAPESRRKPRIGLPMAAALCLSLLLPWGSARADVVIQIEDATVTPGSTPAIEIYCSPTVTTSFSSFNLIVTTLPATPLSSTPPEATNGDYTPIFATGTYGAIPPPSMSNTIGQFYAFASGISTSGTVLAGQTGGVLQFFVEVPLGTPGGDYPMSLTGVEVTDGTGTPIPLDDLSFVGGTLHVLGGAQVIPEPSSLWVWCAAAGVLLIRRRKNSRTRN